MADTTYLCEQCKNIFKLPVVCSITPEKTPEEVEVKCPGCGSSQVQEMPSWGPVDFCAPSLVWQYECQECHNVFELPVPSSPSQERELKCPVCGGGHIHRLTVIDGAPLYCG
jgi:DNA-directed RNA polymerase subunit RPC12/RpoP